MDENIRILKGIWKKYYNKPEHAISTSEHKNPRKIKPQNQQIQSFDENSQDMFKLNSQSMAKSEEFSKKVNIWKCR